jgi:hypothetical protein
LLSNLIECCIGQVELPLFNNLNHSDYIVFYEKTQRLVIDLTIVSSVLLWEITHLIKMSTWKNEHFNYDSFIKQLDSSQLFEDFIKRLLNEFTKIILDNGKVVLDCQQTVLFFKAFNMIRLVVDDAPTKLIKKYLRKYFQEEFKYYFSEDKIRSNCYTYYPITQDLLNDIKKLEAFIL